MDLKEEEILLHFAIKNYIETNYPDIGNEKLFAQYYRKIQNDIDNFCFFLGLEEATQDTRGFEQRRRDEVDKLKNEIKEKEDKALAILRSLNEFEYDEWYNAMVEKRLREFTEEKLWKK